MTQQNNKVWFITSAPRGFGGVWTTSFFVCPHYTLMLELRVDVSDTVTSDGSIECINSFEFMKRILIACFKCIILKKKSQASV